MKRACLPLPGRSLWAAAALLVLTVSASPGLEPRLWISLDGRTLDAELVRSLGDSVELKDKDGRIIKLSKTQLSFGDQDYIAEFAPEEKKSGFAPSTPPKVRMPNPAKEVKLDTKLFKKDAGSMDLAKESFKIMETPHFKLLSTRPADPSDTAELAERLWHDTAFFHGSFAAKWKDKKMLIVLAESETQFLKIGEWYRALLKAEGEELESKNQAARAKDFLEAGDSVERTWKKSGANRIQLPKDLADAQKVFQNARIFRIYAKTPIQGADSGKGVWRPQRTHMLASDLLALQAGGTSDFAKEGLFAIFMGYGFYKEIDLTGECVTTLIVEDSDKKMGSAEGYANAKNWASELKKRIRKGDVKPNIVNLFGNEISSAKPDDMALAYGFSRYLQSTQARHTAFNKLMERISVSHQVPDPDGVAKIYGLANGAALEKDWIAWMDSGDFR